METIKKDLTAYKAALQADAFLQELSFFERVQVHQFRAGHITQAPEKVEELEKWTQTNHWTYPTIQYSTDRLLGYLDNTGQWHIVKKMSREELQQLFTNN